MPIRKTQFFHPNFSFPLAFALLIHFMPLFNRDEKSWRAPKVRQNYSYPIKRDYKMKLLPPPKYVHIRVEENFFKG